MELTTIFIFVIVSLVISLIVIYLTGKQANSITIQLNEQLEKQLQFTKEELKQERALLSESRARNNELSVDNSTLEANLYNLRERYDELLHDERSKNEKFEMIANMEEALILDVRHQADFAKGHIPGAIFIGINL